jgi:serine/threonine protein kinase
MNPSTVGIGILSIVGVILAVAIAVLLISYLIVPIFKGLAWLITRLFHFVAGMLKDSVRFIGALLAIIVFSPLVVLNIIIGRWSASAHFGRAIKNELSIGGACLFRVLLAHPARLVALDGLVEGLEQRLPEAMAQAPTSEPHGKRTGQFEGYKIVGSLPTGGSGSKLYIAEPDPIKRAALERSGFRDVNQVVIKSFSVADGSNLPNIVRESRALEAAKKLGLVLDHELSPAKFYYVMRYVPGQTLNVVVQQLHGESDPTMKPPGLDDRHLRLALGYVADLARTLEEYHAGGLWHKDVKPENIIVETIAGRPRAHLVDFGLVTPLRSAMTLTTHGTEYFRDPELVRLALRGVKVHEVDGAKFDVYAAGAVLFAVIENSFPAHGVLSQVTRRCPEAVKWVIRRAMADYDKRYTSAAQMLADLDVVRSAADPFAVRPIELPSMRGGIVEPTPQPDPVAQTLGGMMGAAGAVGAAAAGVRGVAGMGGGNFAAVPPPLPRQDAPASPKRRPDIRVVNWWTGEHVEVPEGPSSIPNQGDGPFGFDASGIRATAHDIARKSSAMAQDAMAAARVKGFQFDADFGMGAKAREPRVRADGVRRTAREQIEAARARVAARRDRIQSRRAAFAGGASYSNKPNAGAFVGLFIFLAAGVGFGGLLLTNAARDNIPAATVEPSQPGGGRTSATTEAVRDGAIETITYTEKATPAKTSKKSRSKTAAAPVITEPNLLPEGSTATMLLLSDLPAPLSDESKKILASMTDTLRTAGFALTGDTPDARIEDRDTIDRLAAARVAVSGTEVGSPRFRDGLSSWASEKGIDLVVWLRPQTDRAGKADLTKPPVTHIVSQAELAEKTRDIARDAIAVALKNASAK